MMGPNSMIILENLLEDISIRQDWLKTDNKYAIGDRVMIKTDNGKYMNLISIIGSKK